MKKLFYTLCLLVLIVFYSCEESNNPPPLNNSATTVTGYFQANGDFYKTTNSAVTWTNKGNGHGIGAPDIKGISFIDNETGFFQEEGNFWITTNSGDTWTNQGNSHGIIDVDQISFVD